MNIKAIFFDLDDTLAATSEHDAHAFLAVQDHLINHCHAHFEGTRRLIKDFKTALESFPWDPASKVSVSKWRARLWMRALQVHLADNVQNASELGCHLQNIFDTERLRGFCFKQDVPDLLRYLYRRNISAAVITNGHPQVQRAKLRACKAQTYFPCSETIIVGGEEICEGRSEKPASSIFLRACTAVRCKPREAVHVGDNMCTDVQARRYYPCFHYFFVLK